MCLDGINKHWTDLIDSINNGYNNQMIHSATHVTPNDALEPSNWAKSEIMFRNA